MHKDTDTFKNTMPKLKAQTVEHLPLIIAVKEVITIKLQNSCSDS